ncbi:MAG: 2-C-methyl-D-erythritol 4-phosphate cytidylyltransferase [Prevotella sp.]|nr:2-C-methyl-D-erythritol 4-phosphate cytidylyltransferase [Prevotella sp.]
MNIAIILSGGVGTRMGANIPKQYIMVAEKPVIIYSIEKFVNSGSIDAYIIALDEQWKDFVEGYVSKMGIKEPVMYSAPGETREHTIYNALRCAKAYGYADDDIVIIHDAVRPMVSKEVIDDCLQGCRDYDAAIATIDVKDTIYMSVADNCITDVPKRSTLHAGQTPEAFKLGKYLKIHDERTYEEICAVTGGAEFACRCGLKVYLSKGEEINFKLTTPEDLQRFEQIVKEEK